MLVMRKVLANDTLLKVWEMDVEGGVWTLSSIRGSLQCVKSQSQRC